MRGNLYRGGFLVLVSLGFFCRVILFVINANVIQFVTLKRFAGITASKCWHDF